MPGADTLQRFIARVESNAHVEAIREFYTEHASMQENDEPPRVGRETLVAHERKALSRVASVRSECVRPVFAQGDHVVIRWIFEFTGHDGSVRRIEELAWQRWEGERIAEEKFFYDPEQFVPRKTSSAPKENATMAFTLSSPDIPADGTIDRRFEFDGFGCSGENKSPALKWSGAPAGTKSFAVTCYDPDAPTGSGWWHWFVINVPADTTELQPDAGAVGGANLPKGASHVRIDYGVAGWGGVCPPEGDPPHRYIFTVHALSVEKLEIPPDATAALAGFMVNANSLGKASFTAKYGRPKAK